MKIAIALLLSLTTMLLWGFSGRGPTFQLLLQPGQSLRLELSSGDYRIEPGEADKLVFLAHTKESFNPRFGVQGSADEAVVKVEAPRKYSALIRIPQDSNLKVRLEGGSLQIDGIRGNKDIESRAGAVSIAVGEPGRYRAVEASVGLGHINAGPFHEGQDGIDHYLHHDGPGQYQLRAHVGSGEITLY